MTTVFFCNVNWRITSSECRRHHVQEQAGGPTFDSGSAWPTAVPKQTTYCCDFTNGKWPLPQPRRLAKWSVIAQLENNCISACATGTAFGNKTYKTKETKMNFEKKHKDPENQKGRETRNKETKADKRRSKEKQKTPLPLHLDL